MNTANASEFVKTHIRYVWEAPESADERTVATEAVAALYSIASGWIDILALEARIGFYDQRVLTEAQARPAEPYHLLRSTAVGDTRIKPQYRPIEMQASVLDVAAAGSWVDAKLSEVRVDESCYEPSLRELLVVGLRAQLPGNDSSEQLRVSCYAGEIDVTTEGGWVAAPADPPGVPDPISLRLTNLDGALRMILEIMWSPWASDTEPVAPVREGLARLEARGWRTDE